MSPPDALSSPSIPDQALQLQSTVRADGQLEVGLALVPVPRPAADQVTIRVEAAPINPSDLGLLVGPADLDQAEQSGTAERPLVRAPIPKAALGGLAARIDEPMGVGNEGAGVVVAAGESEAAQALLGKTVAFIGGDSYTQYRTVPVAMLLPMTGDTTPREAASSFVNPLTALGMVETMRLEGHTALVHTAAASNLGQMLVRICQKDGIDLVNIVRRQEQEDLLRGLGAQYVCNSSAPDFREQLTDALAETGATLGFDATGGGTLAGEILSCMEAALVRKADAYSRYGSATHKQVYMYGRLDLTPATLRADVGLAWGLGGWLLTPFLAKLGPDVARLYGRVASEIRTTFASHYTGELSLAEAVSLPNMKTYQRKATGEKYLICPQR